MNAIDKHHWEVALRGIQRFYDEGMLSLSREKFNLLFPSEDIAKSIYVLDKLRELESQGVITIEGTDETFIKVLKM